MIKLIDIVKEFREVSTIRLNLEFLKKDSENCLVLEQDQQKLS